MKLIYFAAGGETKFSISSSTVTKTLIVKEDFVYGRETMTVREHELYSIKCELTTPFPIKDVEIEVNK